MDVLMQNNLLNSKADIIAEFGVFPGDNTGVEVENSFFLKNQTTLCTNLDQSRFVAAGYFHDQLVFYRFENNKIIKVREYFSMNWENRKGLLHLKV